MFIRVPLSSIRLSGHTMSDVAIRVEKLGKMYRIGGQQERYKRFTETVMDTLTAPIHRLRRGEFVPPAVRVAVEG